MQATLAAEAAPPAGFSDLGLSPAVLQALLEVGYEVPSPIQAATIPVVLAGTDVLGQAQTGTGKTAAFALPILSRIDLDKMHPQALVLVPTRELAIQVAEAFQRYAVHMKGFHVLPIYGGQSYVPQLKGLKRGAHVIVGTPGRVMDHMKRGTLSLETLQFLVLDEADEMLQMGFVDAIEWVLEQSPPQRQIALFSATIPSTVRRIAQRHLQSPSHITIQSKTSTAPNIRQRYWLVSGLHKLDALTRILEAETFEALLIFVRTKLETVELAERLQARGFDAAPLNGDIPQAQRERTINALKLGKLDIVVATDVAARGLDVERVSHVINYDVPYDSESYVHRIGRTGRAGRSGEAILFIAPRERNMLRIIERATRQQIEQMSLPTVADVNERRVARFKERVSGALAVGGSADFRPLIEQLERENDVSALDIAAALAGLLQGDTPLLLSERRSGGGADSDVGGAVAAGRTPGGSPVHIEARNGASRNGGRGGSRREDRGDAGQSGRGEVGQKGQDEVGQSGRREAGHGDHLEAEQSRAPAVDKPAREARPERATGERGVRHANGRNTDAPPSAPRGRRRETGRQGSDEIPFETFRIEVGHVHGVKPGNIVGAIANEAGLEGRYIGQVDIRADHSFVDLPEGMPKDIFRSLKKTRVAGQELRIKRAEPPPR